MNCDKLTGTALAARTDDMMHRRFRSPSCPIGFGRRAARVVLAVGMIMAVTGCISVSAPDKPIVIELNINIKQEVVYRLAADAGNTIDANPGLF